MSTMTPWNTRCRRQREAQDRAKRKGVASRESTSEDVSDSVRESAPGLTCAFVATPAVVCPVEQTGAARRIFPPLEPMSVADMAPGLGRE
jgi:hypothetical protein